MVPLLSGVTWVGEGLEPWARSGRVVASKALALQFGFWAAMVGARSGKKKKAGSACGDKKKADEALGCHGGKKGGRARASSLSAARRKEIASMGAKAKGRGKKKRGRGGFFKGQTREL